MSLPAWRIALGIATCSAAWSSAWAQAAIPVETPERLSDWLLRQRSLPGSDLLALSWRSAAEVPAQAAQKTSLVAALKAQEPALAQWVASLPATGRVPVPNADPMWMKANLAAEPVLQPGDSVHLPRRSEWVAVVSPSGLLCLVGYQPEVALTSYLRACGQQEEADRAWLVQPDGQRFHYGLRAWNRQAQLPPAPGAWIWAPGSQSRLDTATSEALAQFLATQGPAPGAAERTVLQRRVMDTALRADSLRDLPATTNDWGVIGLWQTPTARLGKTGSVGITFSRADPYNNLSVRLQPFDWLAGAFRYTDVLNQAYGPANASGDQSYKDKSADLKIRLLKESAWLPQVAVGWRDILGTGVFSGEYLVANKRAGDFDVSLGLGFGYLGARGDVGNPLGLVSSKFKERPTAGNVVAGKFNPRAYFRGRAALFGGVQYHTPWDKLILKAEYEGNDYQHESFGQKLPARSALNVGAVWRVLPAIDLSLAYERGNTVVFALSAQTQLDGMTTPKYLDAPAIPVSPGRAARAGDASRTARDIEQQSGMQVAAIEQQGSRWTAVATNPYLGYANPAVERALAALHRDAPPEVGELAVRFQQRGTALAQVSVDRDRWAQNKTQLLPPVQHPAPLQTQNVPPAEPPSQPAHVAQASAFSYGLGLSYRQNLGGPDAFLLFQVAAEARAEWRLRQDTWLAGTYRVSLIDNYDKFKYTAPSDLPRVRTLLREYAVASRDTIPNLQLTHMGQLGSNHFYLAYAGLLESMYAGAGFEYLYRPVNARLALGFDANTVQQRGFEQKFSLRDYRVKTGHINAIWDTGFADLLTKVSVGQYLAGDRGVTVDVSKPFRNGVTIGVYATKTNVSAAQFGEGSFDKGLYLKIPFDVMLPKSGPSSALIVYNPLIRDGGARLGRRYNLYELTSLRDPRAMVEGTQPR